MAQHGPDLALFGPKDWGQLDNLQHPVPNNSLETCVLPKQKLCVMRMLFRWTRPTPLSDKLILKSPRRPLLPPAQPTGLPHGETDEEATHSKKSHITTTFPILMCVCSSLFVILHIQACSQFDRSFIKVTLASVLKNINQVLTNTSLFLHCEEPSSCVPCT